MVRTTRRKAAAAAKKKNEEEMNIDISESEAEDSGYDSFEDNNSDATEEEDSDMVSNWNRNEFNIQMTIIYHNIF